MILLDQSELGRNQEIFRLNEKSVGCIRATSYGHTLGAAVGLAMVDAGKDPLTTSWLSEGQWTIEVVNRHYKTTVSLRPFYDLGNTRIRR